MDITSEYNHQHHEQAKAGEGLHGEIGMIQSVLYEAKVKGKMLGSQPISADGLNL